MKNSGKRILAALLSALMILEMAQLSLASAAEAVDRALNPAEQIELSVPEELQDAGNIFFFGQSAYYLSETSRDKVYIPVQRTGETGEEAEVTVKVVDLTSHWGENYTFEIYKEKVDPVMEYGDVSLVDLVQTAVIDEVEQADEDEIGEILYLNGGADIVNLMKRLQKYYLNKGIPVIIDEFGASNRNNEDTRAAWAKFYVSTADSYGIPCVLWDNNQFGAGSENLGLLNRNNLTIAYPKLLAGLMEGAKNRG